MQPPAIRKLAYPAFGADDRGGVAQLDDEPSFRALAESTAAAIVVFRQEILYVNPAFAQLSGYPPSELLGMDWLELAHPDFREELDRRREASLQGGPVPGRFELILLTSDGQERWVDFAATRILLDGQPAVLASAFDITDRKEAELALRVSRERLELANKSAGLVAWDWNLLSDEMVFAEGSAELLGIPAEELATDSKAFLERWLHPDDRERTRAAVRAAIRENRDFRVEHRAVSVAGQVRWFSARGRAIRDEAGWVVRLIGVSLDITERKEAELALRASSERLRLMVEQMPAILWTTDPELRFTSSVGAGLAALNTEPNAVSGQQLRDYLNDPMGKSEALQSHERALAGSSVSYQMQWAGNAYQVHVEPLRDHEGTIAGTIGIALDVTERIRVEDALRREQGWAQTTLASIDDGVIRTDSSGIVEYLNPVAERLTGFSSAQAIGQPLEKIYHVVDESSRAPLIHPAARCLRERRPVMLPGQRLLVKRDGSEYAVRDSAAPILAPDGEMVGAVLAFKDISAVRDIEREMHQLSTHDGLTGLPNRSAFERRLARSLERSAATGETLVVLQVDLSRLKVVNDTCGHLAGDEMIRGAARHLASWAGDRFHLARLGPEEFGFVVERLSAAEAQDVAESLKEALLDYRFSWQDRVYEVQANIGLVAARTGDTPSSLMIASDIACMVAKESGRNRIHEYRAEDPQLAHRYLQMDWIHRIYRALETDSFRLYCQPIQPLDPRRADEGTLGEVLIRMVGEDGELVLPRTFVPAAERYRLISSIDRWVVAKSLKMLSQGVVVGGQQIDRLAINLSGETLADEAFLKYVVATLEATAVEPSRILFEVTETAAIANLDGALRFIHELRGRGVRFVLDDFGSGLSSFAYLKNLPVDYLKISAEFIHGIETTPMHRTLVRSINQIGHELGLEVIGEGVESEAILSALLEVQLDYVQGYWIAQPQPIEEPPAQPEDAGRVEG
ncbi:MAG: EAL domain-containing protein [Thermoanaerobaculia bacterium]